MLDVDPGKATNRTVVTVVGSPEPLVEAVFRGIKKAAELIDMSKHAGEHPRFGATDVCPFVPVANATMDDCIELARKLGERVGKVDAFAVDVKLRTTEHDDIETGGRNDDIRIDRLAGLEQDARFRE